MHGETLLLISFERVRLHSVTIIIVLLSSVLFYNFLSLVLHLSLSSISYHNHTYLIFFLYFCSSTLLSHLCVLFIYFFTQLLLSSSYLCVVCVIFFRSFFINPWLPSVIIIAVLSSVFHLIFVLPHTYPIINAFFLFFLYRSSSTSSTLLLFLSKKVSFNNIKTWDKTQLSSLIVHTNTV